MSAVLRLRVTHGRPLGEPSISSNALRTLRQASDDTYPTTGPSSNLLTVTRWVKLTTESCGNPDYSFDRKTIPWTLINPMFEEITARTVVRHADRLKASPWMTSAGWLPPGSDPRDVPKPYQWTAP